MNDQELQRFEKQQRSVEKCMSLLASYNALGMYVVEEESYGDFVVVRATPEKLKEILNA
jgi:hypothetical protein